MSGGFLLGENSIHIVRGTSRTLALCVKDAEGHPVNLTGARVVFTVKCRVTDDSPRIQKDSAEGVLEVDIDDPLNGEAKIYIQPEDTSTMDVGTYVFDVWVILSSGTRHLVVGPGEFVVVAGVTVLP